MNLKTRCEKLDCFGNKCGRCAALETANWDKEGRACPFYKTDEQFVRDQDAALEHLIETGQQHLIKKYYIDQGR